MPGLNRISFDSVKSNYSQFMCMQYNWRMLNLHWERSTTQLRVSDTTLHYICFMELNSNKFLIWLLNSENGWRTSDSAAFLCFGLPDGSAQNVIVIFRILDPYTTTASQVKFDTILDIELIICVSFPRIIRRSFFVATFPFPFATEQPFFYPRNHFLNFESGV